MPWWGVVVIVAVAGIASGWVAALAWRAHVYVNNQAKAGQGQTLYVCDKHGPTRAYEVFPGDLAWQTVEGQRRRGPVRVCVLCFEDSIKLAAGKLPPLPKNAKSN